MYLSLGFTTIHGGKKKSQFDNITVKHDILCFNKKAGGKQSLQPDYVNDCADKTTTY